MIKIVIKGWNDANAWTDWGGSVRKQLLNRLRVDKNISDTELKRLVRRILDRECFQFEIGDRVSGEGIRHVLESIGAEVLLIEA